MIAGVICFVSLTILAVACSCGIEQTIISKALGGASRLGAAAATSADTGADRGSSRRAGVGLALLTTCVKI